MQSALNHLSDNLPIVASTKEGGKWKKLGWESTGHDPHRRHCLGCLRSAGENDIHLSAHYLKIAGRTSSQSVYWFSTLWSSF